MNGSTYKQRIAFKVFNYTFFAVLSFLMLYPFWYSFISSITPYSEIMGRAFPLVPRGFDLSAYRQIIADGILTDAYLVTLSVTAAGVLCSMVFTVMGAYVLSVENLPGRKVIMVAIIFTMFFSGGVIPTYILFSNLRLINSFAVYIAPQLINTVFMLIIRTAFREVPVSLKDAAEIDGCNHLRLLAVINVRLCLPTIAVIVLFYTVDKWNDLYTALFFITDYKKFTLQAALYSMLSTTESSGPVGSGGAIVEEQVKYAAIILTILPVVCVYPFLQRYFTKGVLLGSVKE